LGAYSLKQITPDKGKQDQARPDKTGVSVIGTVVMYLNFWDSTPMSRPEGIMFCLLYLERETKSYSFPGTRAAEQETGRGN
jgi:hypothetical protein